MQAAVLNRNVKGIELIFFPGVGMRVLQGFFRAWVLAKSREEQKVYIFFRICNYK